MTKLPSRYFCSVKHPVVMWYSRVFCTKRTEKAINIASSVLEIIQEEQHALCFDP